MFFYLFKKKWFWIVWLIVSIIGGLIGYVGSNQREQNYNNGKYAKVLDFRQSKYPSIIGIKNLNDKEVYIRIFMDSTIKTLDVPSSIIENGKMVKILSYTDDSLLIQVAVKNRNTTSTKPPYQEIWLWKEFVNVSN
jgi:hypothetical protein